MIRMPRSNLFFDRILHSYAVASSHHGCYLCHIWTGQAGFLYSCVSDQCGQKFSQPLVRGGGSVWAIIIGMCRCEGYNFPLILLPLCPASLTHKNPQRCNIIHCILPVGCKERSIDLKMFVENLVRVISVAVNVVVV